MKVLAIELSSSRRSACAWNSEAGSIPETIWDEDVSGGRNSRALALVESALAAGGMERREVECLALGLGPGSYTGVRVAIAIAQGWAAGLGIRVAGVSSAEALARDSWREGVRGRTGIAFDAQRGELCVGWFEISETGVGKASPLKLISAAAFVSAQPADLVLRGPDLSKLLPPTLHHSSHPSARSIAELAVQKGIWTRPSELEPIYIRPDSYKTVADQAGR
ncbi:MAG: tRNA (adenosine(37)-N6)-threonylcarbamoyltransferase complex dimerization subunit type 1 TsaB [Verrucomicrobia bacterium]|nr:tRNA (adenosine(37)-N6)-threonylcarbamoyltransferase complex dimerization subunit type 1 TsaB [Verrucomicrobiota bacterium]